MFNFGLGCSFPFNKYCKHEYKETKEEGCMCESCFVILIKEDFEGDNCCNLLSKTILKKKEI